MAPPHRCSNWVLLGALSAALAPPTAATGAPPAAADQNPEAQRPSASKRVVRLFDFEESDFNLEPVPRYWVRAQQTPTRARAGFPPWNEPRFDHTRAVSGEWSVLLPANGGSAALRLASGVIPILPGAEYAVTVMVRTQGVVHSRARLAARLVDEQHQPIPGALAVSQPIRSESDWVEARVELSTDSPSAAWLQIELQLLQPDQLSAKQNPFGDPGAAAGGDTLSTDGDAPAARFATQQDYHAAAWFDDVRVLLAPRVSLTTNSPINIIEAPDTPVITATVRDVAGESLLGDLRLLDVDGAVLDSRSVIFLPGARAMPWRPKLGAYGWKRATLTLRAPGGHAMARVNTDFIWTPERTEFGSIDARRFEILLNDPPPAARDAVMRVFQASLSGAVEFPLWREDLSLSELGSRLTDLQPMLDALLESGAQITMALNPTPIELAQRLRVDPASSLLLLQSDPPSWSAYYSEAVARLGQRITRWRIGRARSDQALRLGEQFAERLHNLHAAIEKLAPSVKLVAPWPAEATAPDLKGEDAALLVAAPPTFAPRALADLAKELSSADDATILITPRSGPSAFDRAGAADLAARIVWAWREGAHALALEQPFTWSIQGPRTSPQPTALLAAWRQAIERLTERRFIADAPAPPGGVAMLFGGPAGGMLVAWAEGADAVGMPLPLYVGDRTVRARDIFGNVWNPDVKNGQLELTLTSEPVFIEGVDALLLALQAGFQVEPAFLPSLATRHDMAVRLENPYPRAIAGALRIDSPEGWEIRPRVLHFTLGPGERVRLPFEAAFGVSEPAGPRDVWATASLQLGVGEQIIRLRAPIEVGLENIVLTPIVSPTAPRRSGRPGDVLVTLLVTNVGDAPVSLEGFAQAPGFPREQASISDLPPGETGLVRFLFREGAKSLSGRDIRVGVMEIAGLARLNAVVAVP